MEAAPATVLAQVKVAAATAGALSDALAAHFDMAAVASFEGAGADWQGISSASWDYPRPAIVSGFGGLNLGFTPPPPPGGSLRVVTTKMRPGYLRKNGVPYSGSTVLTEYFDRFDVPGGETILLVTSEVNDPEYLAQPFWTSTNFKKENDGSGWSPTTCTPR